jgi:hypothetical protein
VGSRAYLALCVLWRLTKQEGSAFHNYKMHKHIDSSFQLRAFNCLFCGAYASQHWSKMIYTNSDGNEDYVLNAYACQCSHCARFSFWYPDGCVYPISGAAPLPNADMPNDIKADYEEARNILALSPRGAAALLRLAVQKLCAHLGEPGKNIDKDIASLVKKGLPEVMQQALDSVRVVGNNAVHPGQIDLTDNTNIASGLFAIVNFICENRITQPRMISQFYHATVPEETKGHIDKRDGKA